MNEESKEEKKTKAGKYCPFRPGHKCGDFCGLWASGLQACVLHGLNSNMGNTNKILERIEALLSREELIPKR